MVGVSTRRPSARAETGQWEWPDRNDLLCCAMIRRVQDGLPLHLATHDDDDSCL